MDEEVLNSQEYIAFHDEWKSWTMVVYKPHFDYLATMYLDLYPHGGSAAYRLADGKKGILIDWDFFTSKFNADYRDVIDVEVEHEIFEMWQTRNRSLDQPYDPHDPAHYEAIKHALKFAKSKGLLKRYMQFKRVMLNTYAENGDDFARQESEFYEDYYKEINTPISSL